MKKTLIYLLASFFILLSHNISSSQTRTPAELLQSFKPRGILLNQFLQTCQQNNISLLKVEDRMGNKSKKTRFTTYNASLIYLTSRGRRQLHYQYKFKDDTLMAVKSY
jgi:hypothetical protein